MKLVSLKQSGSDTDAPSEKAESYPMLYLEAKQAAALGLKSPRMGDTMMFEGTVRVSSMSKDSLSFEIMEGGVEPLAAEKDDASVLFPNEGKA